MVTGSHRSGTTWAGRMLAAAPGVGYIHEPFNPGIAPGVLGEPLPAWFLHIDHANEAEYAARFEGLLDYRYPLVRNLARISSIAEISKLLGDQRRMVRYRLRGDRPLVKDPIAIFSAEWLAARFGFEVLVMIRHPAAFCASLIAMDWHFDFSNFSSQPSLIGRYLAAFAGEIADHAANPRDITGQAILLWNCIYTAIGEYRNSHPRWQFVRHEDISRNPEQGFSDIYEGFGLAMNRCARAAIMAAFDGHNPADWRRFLSPEQIERIRSGTAVVAAGFYAEDDW